MVWYLNMGSSSSGFDRMATSFRKVRGRMAPERQARIMKLTEELLEELPSEERLAEEPSHAGIARSPGCRKRK